MVSIGNHKRGRIDETPDSIGRCEETGCEEVSLVFSSSFDQDEIDGTFCLMRPPNSEKEMNIIEEGLQNKSLYISGDADGEAVLVTKDSTYALIRSETSNAMLVASPPGFGRDSSTTEGIQVIVANCPSVIELEKCHTTAGKLHEVLLKYGSSVGSNGKISEEHGITINKLSETIHMSHAEIRAELEILGALKVVTNTGGQGVEEKWMLVDDILINRLTDACLNIIMEQGFDLDNVPLKAVQCALESSDGFEPVLVRHCLLLLASKPPSDGDEEPMVALCERRKVPEFRAHQVFHRKRADRLPKDEFLSSWEAAMPGVGTPDQDILCRIVIPEVDCSAGAPRDYFRYVPERLLPCDPSRRLAKLFEIKPKWPRDQLAAYLDPLCNPDFNIDDIFLKYTRTKSVVAREHENLMCFYSCMSERVAKNATWSPPADMHYHIFLLDNAVAPCVEVQMSGSIQLYVEWKEMSGYHTILALSYTKPEELKNLGRWRQLERWVIPNHMPNSKHLLIYLAFSLLLSATKDKNYVKRLVHMQGYSVTELEIEFALNEAGHDPKIAAGVICSRKQGKNMSNRNGRSRSAASVTATSAVPKRKQSSNVNKNKMMFPYQEQSKNLLFKNCGGGGLVEHGQNKRSRVKLYDPNLLEGEKGATYNISNAVDSHPTGGLSYNKPTAASARNLDVWRDSKPISQSLMDDSAMNETIECLKPRLEGSSNVEGGEFSFPSSWPAAAAADAAPHPVPAYNLPPPSCSAEAEQVESETVAEMKKGSDEPPTEAEHFTKMLDKLRRRLSGLQRALEKQKHDFATSQEESSKWQGYDVKERSQAAFRVLEQVKLTGFSELRNHMKQNLIDEMDLLLERLSSYSTSDGNNVGAAQIELAAQTIRDVRISMETVFKGIIYEYTRTFRDKSSSSDSQEAQNKIHTKDNAGSSSRRENAASPGVMNYDSEAPSSMKSGTMEAALSEFEAKMIHAKDIVVTMEQHRAELRWLQSSNTESVDSIRATLSKVSQMTSELRSLIKRRRATLEEKKHQKDIAHSELQQLIPTLQDLSVIMDAVQVGDAKVQEAFERRKLAMLELKKAEDSFNSAQADYITHSSTVAMCVAMVEGLNESFSRFIRGQIEKVQQALSEDDKLLFLALESVKRSSQLILDFTNESSVFALKSAQERKSELITHTKLFGSTSPENETRLKTLVYEMEQAYAFAMSNAAVVVHGLLELRERLNLLLTGESMERVDIIGLELLNGESGRKALTEYRLKRKETESSDLSKKCNLQ